MTVDRSGEKQIASAPGANRRLAQAALLDRGAVQALLETRELELIHFLDLEA